MPFKGQCYFKIKSVYPTDHISIMTILFNIFEQIANIYKKVLYVICYATQYQYVV
jgi:hypothetical protein